MSASMITPQTQHTYFDSSIQATIEDKIEDLITSLPLVEELSYDQRREMIARYTAVLEGNFIYWMTAAYLSVHSEEARHIIAENLHEEVRDSHPVMLRKFALAAQGFPTSEDAIAVHDELTGMRLFLGKMSGSKTVLSMAYLEGFIQRFMAYLAKLAVAQGSTELEYTDVHGVCDIAHTDGLFRALSLELAADPVASTKDLFEGVELLDVLIKRVVYGSATMLVS